MIRRGILVLLAAMTVAVTAAQAPAQVTVNVFPGGFNWPSFVAREKGFFERNGIAVTLQPTPTSVAQMTGLAEGTLRSQLHRARQLLMEALDR